MKEFSLQDHYTVRTLGIAFLFLIFAMTGITSCVGHEDDVNKKRTERFEACVKAGGNWTDAATDGVPDKPERCEFK